MAAMSSQGHGEVLEDYWREFNEIEDDRDHDGDEDDLPKTPDEGELEAQWLTEAGYGFIVNKVKGGVDLSDDELDAVTETLTRSQADAVLRRVNTLTSTTRKKRATSKVHVKDIFPTPDNSSPEPPSPSSIVDEIDFLHTPDPHTPTRQKSFLNRKGGYSLEAAEPEPAKSMEQGVEALSFKETGSFAKRPKTRTTSSRSIVPMPSISDADISVDFHLEQKDNQLSEEEKNVFKSKEVPKPEPHKVDLPAFETKSDPLGVTFIGDLGEVDMPRIRSLALIELTALFDLYDITYSRPKRKKKPKEHGLFGVPLQTLVENDQKRIPGIKVPLFFQSLVNQLEKDALLMEGILRIPGAVSRVKQIRQELEDKFYAGTFSWTDVLPNDCAALLKQFLRELPIPLLTYEYLDAFPHVERIPQVLEQLKALNLLILLLPTEHREVLKSLLDLLRKIIRNSHINKMGLNNVCMIMAPNLFLAPTVKGDRGKIESHLELSKATNTSNIVKMLIHYQHVLWVIPSSFLIQVRYQYKSEANRKLRDKMRPWKKKDKSDAYKKPSAEQIDGQTVRIRVQAPDLTKSSCWIQLDEQMKAGDIVDRFRRDYGSTPAGQKYFESQNRSFPDGSAASLAFKNPNNGHFADNKAYLFEMGGNISERCLDPSTNMLQLYQVNPTAEWVLRTNVDR